MEAICGEWNTLHLRGKLLIREHKGYYMLTSYCMTPNGHIDVSHHRLQGGRCLHYGSGKKKTYLRLTGDGKTLQLLPGNCYKRKELPTPKK